MNMGWPGIDARQAERRNLQRDSNFIGTGMVFLILMMNMTFSVILIPLLLSGIVRPEAVTSDPFLGLGNTRYLLLYGSVYAISMGLPMILAALIFRPSVNPFCPHRRVKITTLLPALLAGMAMCMVANLLASSIMETLISFGIQPPVFPELLEPTPVSLLLNILIVAVLPAILEEMVFRGYVLQVLRPYGDGTAIVISALLFSLMHGNLLQIPFAFLVGLVLCFIVVQTNNIWLAIILHFLNNLFSVLIDYFTMGMDDIQATQVTFFAFLIIGVVGLLSLIPAFLAKSNLFHPLKASSSFLTAKERAGALLSSPMMLISILLFVLSTLFSIEFG